MTFLQAVQTCFAKGITLEGRASRSEYWYWVLFMECATFLLGLLILLSGDTLLGDSLQGLIYLLYVPLICVTTRRLHDIDRSGWWQALQYTAMLLATLLYAWYLASAHGLKSLQILSTATVLKGFLVAFAGRMLPLLHWLITEGDRDDNRFGPDPLERDQSFRAVSK